MATINITTDAGFKNGVGSIGITFWFNDDINGFKSVNYVVQNVIFISNYEAELFGMYTGLLKLSKILEMKRRGERTNIPFFDSLNRIQTVNVYCDNFTALSCFGSILYPRVPCDPLRMTKEMIVNVAVNDFFNTMATFSEIPLVILRNYIHEPLVRCICEKLFNVLDTLRPSITIGYMRHVHGHSISGDKDVKTFEKIFCGGKELVTIPAMDKRPFNFPSIKTANTFVELYSNCIADAVASRRISDLERFSNVCVIDDQVEKTERCEIAREHRSLVAFRRICSKQSVIDITADEVDFVSSLCICPRLFDRIIQTFEELFGIAEAEVIDLEVEEIDPEEEENDLDPQMVKRIIHFKTKTKITKKHEKKTTKTKK